MDTLRLYVSVPLACFRVAQAREYWETYPCPPPSTVYGMLLSLVGEPNRLVHQGTEIAIASLAQPDRSVVLRTLWRIKDRKAGPGLGNNKRPDFQELLAGTRLCVWVRAGENENAQPSLLQRLQSAFNSPASICRFGGLSLGESAHLVDEMRPWKTNTDPTSGRMLTNNKGGNLSMPIWPDHVGSRNTRWGQFSLSDDLPLKARPESSAWIRIQALDKEK
jgi:CRISPR-associated protein Cas5t